MYDSQENTLQTQLFRSADSTKRCIADVMRQLTEQGGWNIVRSEAGNTMAFDAYDEEEGSDRKISVDVFEAYLND